jgi:hypothetical protein
MINFYLNFINSIHLKFKLFKDNQFYFIMNFFDINKNCLSFNQYHLNFYKKYDFLVHHNYN